MEARLVPESHEFTLCLVLSAGHAAAVSVFSRRAAQRPSPPFKAPGPTNPPLPSAPKTPTPSWSHAKHSHWNYQNRFPTVTCPFCDRIRHLDPTAADDAAVFFPDKFPLSPGHTLVVPRKHVASVYDLAEGEQQAVWSLVATIRSRLKDQCSPNGFNIGINDGDAAGQTVAHAHVHVIPRFQDDVVDPRGGIRWVIPERAPYWEVE